MASKTDLDLRVSADLGVPQKKVTEITALFLKHIRRALVMEGEVVLPGLGRLWVLQYVGPSTRLTRGTGKKGQRAGKIAVEHPVHLKVFFKKAPALRSELKGRKR